MTEEAGDRIKKVSEEQFKIPPNQMSCNHFVAAVASELGHKALAGRTANNIFDYLDALWTEVSAKEAALVASWGHFVIAGLRSWEHKRPQDTDGHGHVAIVVQGPLHQGKYPRVYCGAFREPGRSAGDRSSGRVWRKEDRDQVHYYEAPW